MQTNDDRELGRARNAVLELFESRLYIPKIYLDASWQEQRVDVLAVDRDGIGDVHLVLLVKVPSTAKLEHLDTLCEPILKRLSSLSAQYKYIGLVQTLEENEIVVQSVPPKTLDLALSSDGLGRVGFLLVTVPYPSEPKATFLFKPERFRARVADIADSFVRDHSADWELRDSPVA